MTSATSSYARLLRHYRVAADLTQEELAGLLRQPARRRVTVTGPPGIGKTRFTLATAGLLSNEFADGTVFISLVPVWDAAMVPEILAQAFNVRRAHAKSIEQALLSHLRTRHVLLVVDIFEHVLDSGSILAHIVANCPRVTLFVSSRAALNIQGEQRFDLLPVDLPALGVVPELGDFSQFSALQLFVERATSDKPSFQITAENTAAIVEICRRLNGIPLAIALASARVKIVSPPELLVLLERKLNMLTGGPLDLPERQRTLRRAIVWSYDLLTERGKRLFRQLASFPDFFSLDAIEALARRGDDEPCGVLDDLGMLIVRSLVMTLPKHARGTRYIMLEVIRELGLEVLSERGEFEWTYDLHGSSAADLINHERFM